ncbi:hypothetical protein K439DRAFT_1634131 [Ramaria rubella]|nr:hypothetical protein K439DRAFT_1634131 [Ramaria rubella]
MAPRCADLFTKPLPSGKNQVLQLRPPALRAQAPQRRQSTSHPARSTSRLPSPPPHNTQTDRTLRDLVGLISHFEPVARPAPTRPAPITIPSARTSQTPELYPLGSEQNPIEVDAPGPADAVNNALIALAGTVASALKLPQTPNDAPSLSEPTVNNVLHCIKHDPKLIPALQATYEYLRSVPNNSQSIPRSFSHVTTNQPEPPSGRKKRKRAHAGPQIPAGAGHWDVPFPFAPGQEPNGYPSQWQLERGRRVLGELLGLFERGFAKARGCEAPKAGKALSQRPPKKQRTHPDSAVGGSDIGDGVMRASQGVPVDLARPSIAADNVGLDHQRMSEWLSSVPTLPTSSSIIDAVNVIDVPSPSVSDPAPTSLLDFMAMLEPTFSDGPNDNKEPDFDLAGAFDGLTAGMVDDTSWQSLFDSVPGPQSINNIEAFHIPDLQPSVPNPAANDFVIDPILMALSQQKEVQPFQAVPQSTQPAPTSSGSIHSSDPEPLAGAPTPPASLLDSSMAGTSAPHPSIDQSAPIGAGTESVFGDTQSVDAYSLLTVPTGSGSSSQRDSTPTVGGHNAISPAPTASTSGPTKVQRKAAVLAKARAHRDRLLRELERAKVERWELLIEGGVLRNLEKIDTPM